MKKQNTFMMFGAIIGFSIGAVISAVYYLQAGIACISKRYCTVSCSRCIHHGTIVFQGYSAVYHGYLEFIYGIAATSFFLYLAYTLINYYKKQRNIV